MKILFIFSRHSREANHSTLTKDLSDQFHLKGHDVVVVTPDADVTTTSYEVENGYGVLRVKSPSLFKVGGLKKAYATLKVPRLILKDIKLEIGKQKFDAVITHTPFIADHKLILGLKNHFSCPCHLILWDIFPQNAVDLGMLKNVFLRKFFSLRESRLYEAIDSIICMSRGNLEYAMQNFSIKSSKLKIVENWGNPMEMSKSKVQAREALGISLEHNVILFGGNQGKPQSLANIILLGKKLKTNPNFTIYLVGSGTETAFLKKQVSTHQLENIKMIDSVSRQNYLQYCLAADVGLVSLDCRFTVPNFPSKLVDYLKAGLPVVSYTDKVSYRDFGDYLERHVQAGIAVQAPDHDKFVASVKAICMDPLKKKTLSDNARRYFNNNLTAEHAYFKFSEILKS